MKNLFYKFTLIILILILCFGFSACESKTQNEKSSKLTYYAVSNDYVWDYFEYPNNDILDFIKRYNLFCNKNYDDSYKIEIVEFASPKDMLTKMSAEIMAGEGPDIFSTDQKLPFEKLVENNVLADIDELLELYNYDINLDDCNSIIMDAGVFGGKRYIIPINYAPDIFLTTKEILDNYNLSVSDFSFKKLWKQLLNQNNSYSLFGSTRMRADFFLAYIDQYVDFKNKTTLFETDEFSKSLDYMGELFKNDDTDENKLYIFGLENGEYLLDRVSELMWFNLCDMGKTPVLISDYNRKNEISANVQCAVGINANSDKKDKALAFIKYVLSEEGQVKKGESDVIGNIIPVNNNSFDYVIEKLKEYMRDSNDDGEYDDAEKEFSKNVGESFLKEYLGVVNSISECNLFDFFAQTTTYYNTTVIGEIVDNYLNEKITKTKFINQLTAATERYMDE